MKTSFLPALVALLWIPASATLAQDTDAKQNLAKALSQLVSQDTYFTGGITEVEPEKEEAVGGGIRLAVIVGGASNMKSFVGNFELSVSKDSQVAMVSTEDFPGL